MRPATRRLLVALVAVAGALVASLLAVAVFRSTAESALAPIPAGDRSLALALLRTESATAFWRVFLVLVAGLVVPAAAFALWARRVLRPIHDLARSARLAAEGKLEADLPIPDDGIAGELAASVNRVRRGLESKVLEIEEERRLVLSLVRGMHEGLVWVGPGRRIRLANESFRMLFSPARDPEGMLLAEVVRVPALMREIDAALTEGRGTEDTAVEIPGSGRSFLVRVTPLEGKGGGALVLFLDVTRLEALERVRRDFVADVSHELRTPLTSIKAFVETIEEERLEDRARALEFLSIVRRHISRMEALIEDLTDLSLIETGSIGLEIEDVDAAQSAADVVAQLEPRASDAGVRVVVALPSPFVLGADRRRLEQILVNLVDNAVKFSHRGGEVRIGGRDEESRRILLVEDSGSGIPADSLDKIFNRFYRVDKARSREAGGTGLGLSIVRHLMRLHGGQVRVESELGRGSRFILEFPKRAT